MFLKTSFMNNVYQFDVDGENYAHLDFAGFSKETLFLNGNKIAPPKIGGFKILRDQLVFEQTGIGTFITSIDSVEKPKLLTKHDSIPSSYTGKKIIIQDSEKELDNWKILNLENNEMNLCPLKGSLKGRYIFKRDKNKRSIKVYDYYEEKDCIDFSLTGMDTFENKDNLKITQVNIFQEKYLLLTIGENRLVIIDLLTSELLHAIEVNVKESNIGFARAKGSWGNQIFSIYHKGMWLLNIETAKTEFVDLSNEYERYGITPYSVGTLYSYQDHAVFSAFNTKTGATPCSLVALNLATRKITWMHELEFNEIGMNMFQPTISKNTLYVHSQNRNLHIFQHEN